MKKINTQILLIMLLVGNIASIHGASRFFQRIKKVLNGNRGPSQDYPRLPVYNFITGNKHTQDRFDSLMNQAKNGNLISQEDINAYQKSAEITDHHILNQSDEEGHTLLYYLIKDDSKRKKYRCIFNDLVLLGAQFNNRDKCVMGPELYLKVLNSSTQDRFDLLVDKAKNGNLISQADINEYQKSAEITNYHILNQSDEEGHTLLYHLVKDDSKRKKYRRVFNNLILHGAQFNDKDQHVMGPEFYLKALLGISCNASEKETQKALRTFKTKNTLEKLATRFKNGNMTQKQVDARLNNLTAIYYAVQLQHYNNE